MRLLGQESQILFFFMKKFYTQKYEKKCISKYAPKTI